MPSGNLPKILFYDVEWKPALAFVWKMWDENISPDQLVDPGGLLCFSAVWSDDPKKVIFYSEWEHGHQTMVEALHALFEEADALVTYNGDRYDNKKARGEFVLAGLTPPPQITSIDLLKTVKQFGFVMNRLAYIGPLMKIGQKIKNEGFRLWRSVMEGDAAAQKKMQKYCSQDSLLLVELYAKIKPYITNHPHLGDRMACGACDGKVLHSRGYRRTKTFRIQRLQCQTCHSWQDGKREKLT